MPIASWPSSQRHCRVFEESLTHLVKLGRIPSDLSLHPHPMPLFQLGLRDFMHEDRNRAAKHVGWRYFAKSASAFDHVVSGDVGLGAKPRVKHLSYGSLPTKALRIGTSMENHPQLRVHLHEPRVLRIPALLVEAFWLRPLTQKSSKEEAGWIVPYHTLLRDIDPEVPYPINELFQKLRPLAEKTIQGSMALHSTAAGL